MPGRARRTTKEQFVSINALSGITERHAVSSYPMVHTYICLEDQSIRVCQRKVCKDREEQSRSHEPPPPRRIAAKTPPYQIRCRRERPLTFETRDTSCRWTTTTMYGVCSLSTAAPSACSYSSHSLRTRLNKFRWDEQYRDHLQEMARMGSPSRLQNQPSLEPAIFFIVGPINCGDGDAARTHFAACLCAL
jgi:hypothetical protein